MYLLKDNYIKIISVFTILCFITIVALKVYNIYHINNYYFFGFVVMLILMFCQFVMNKNIADIEKTVPFWVILFVWDLIYIVFVFFYVGRYVIRLIK